MLQLAVRYTASDLRTPLVRSSILRKYLRRVEKSHSALLQKHALLLELIYTDDAYIQKLNATWRGKDTPTDVLSFPLADQDFSGPVPVLFGEIYISLPTARRQAKRFRHSLQAELNKLFVHGVLHLLGYDHESDSDFQIMAAMEKKLLSER